MLGLNLNERKIFQFLVVEVVWMQCFGWYCTPSLLY